MRFARAKTDIKLERVGVVIVKDLATKPRPHQTQVRWSEPPKYSTQRPSGPPVFGAPPQMALIATSLTQSLGRWIAMDECRRAGYRRHP